MWGRVQRRESGRDVARVEMRLCMSVHLVCLLLNSCLRLIVFFVGDCLLIIYLLLAYFICISCGTCSQSIGRDEGRKDHGREGAMES